MGNDLPEPPSETVGVLQLRKFKESRHKRVLNRIGSGFIVFANAEGRRKCGRIMSTVQCIPGRRLSRTGRVDVLTVIERSRHLAGKVRIHIKNKSYFD
jgi:hypothetical protein